jgi:hypothetical protein
VIQNGNWTALLVKKQVVMINSQNAVHYGK